MMTRLGDVPAVDFISRAIHNVIPSQILTLFPNQTQSSNQEHGIVSHRAGMLPTPPHARQVLRSKDITEKKLDELRKDQKYIKYNLHKGGELV